MSEKKSDLDVFEDLVQKKTQPSESGVEKNEDASKAPPPPPSLAKPSTSKPNAPPAPPSISGALAKPPPSLDFDDEDEGEDEDEDAKDEGPTAAAAAALMSSGDKAPAPPPAASPPSEKEDQTQEVEPEIEDDAEADVEDDDDEETAGPPPVGGYEKYESDPDDNEPTKMYVPSSERRAAPASSRRIPSVPPPPPSVPPPAPLPVPSAPAPMRSAQASYPSMHGSVPPVAHPRPNTGLYIALGVIAVIGVLVYMMTGRRRSLVITVSGPGGRAVTGVEVYVDGEKVCEASPCKVSDLAPGPRLVRASAKGYQPTADQAVAVEAGMHSTHNVQLARPRGGTGIRVSATGKGLKLFVDGDEIGELPQDVSDLDEGEHVIKVGGNPRYEPFEKKVNVVAEQMQSIGPLKLDVIKGLATFEAGPGADGARVLLDGRRLPKLPVTIEIPGDKKRELVAKKDGYVTYRRTVAFDDGRAEKTFEITMIRGTGEDRGEEEEKKGAGGVAKKGTPHKPGGGGRPSVAEKKTAPAAGEAVLSMNSIPVSNVILNGRPLGPTPRVGVKVPAGQQTVVFVHPEHGRKMMSASVAAGSTKTFMVRFP